MFTSTLNGIEGTLTIQSALLCTIVSLVHNVGTSVAVLGTFSLIRFRSVPGSSREIVSIFFSMAVGLATGMGFLTFAAMMTVLTGVVFLLLMKAPFGESGSKEKDLRITIAENLDYTGIFEDIFQKYTSKCSLQRVNTTNLGSMYELDYHITLKDARQEKEMIDAIRCRNGNLTIICGRRSSIQEEL